MSWQAVDAVFENSRSKGNARLLLLTIAEHADKDTGECWPGIGRLMKRAGLSRATVCHHLDTLKKMGELKVVRKGGGRYSNRYRVMLIDQSRTLTSPDSGLPTIQTAAGVELRLQQSEFRTAAVNTGRHEPSSNASSNLQGIVSSEEAAQAQREGTTEERGTGTPASRRVQGTTVRAITVAGSTKADADDVVDAYLAAGGGTGVYSTFKVGKEAELLLREGVDRAALLVAVRLLATTKRRPWELRQLVVRARVAL